MNTRVDRYLGIYTAVLRTQKRFIAQMWFMTLKSLASLHEYRSGEETEVKYTMETPMVSNEEWQKYLVQRQCQTMQGTSPRLLQLDQLAIKKNYLTFAGREVVLIHIDECATVREIVRLASNDYLKRL
jgi:hypothetical protein